LRWPAASRNGTHTFGIAAAGRFSDRAFLVPFPLPVAATPWVISVPHPALDLAFERRMPFLTYRGDSSSQLWSCHSPFALPTSYPLLTSRGQCGCRPILFSGKTEARSGCCHQRPCNWCPERRPKCLGGESPQVAPLRPPSRRRGMSSLLRWLCFAYEATTQCSRTALTGSRAVLSAHVTVVSPCFVLASSSSYHVAHRAPRPAAHYHIPASLPLWAPQQPGRRPRLYRYR
jgi:hypothetical protein